MIKNVIFDYNGTLVDDVLIAYLAIMDIFEELGLELIDFKTFRKEICLPYMEFYRKYTKASKKTIEILFLEAVRKIPNSELPELSFSTRELLEFFDRKGIKMAILSSYPQEKLEEELEQYEIKRFFKDIVSSHNKNSAITNLFKKK